IRLAISVLGFLVSSSALLLLDARATDAPNAAYMPALLELLLLAVSAALDAELALLAAAEADELAAALAPIAAAPAAAAPAPPNFALASVGCAINAPLMNSAPITLLCFITPLITQLYLCWIYV